MGSLVSHLQENIIEDMSSFHTLPHINISHPSTIRLCSMNSY